MPTKPKTNQPETPVEVQGRDKFQTPRYAVELLIPFVPKHVEYIWECAAGEGKIVSLLEEHNYKVISTDIDGRHMKHNFILDPLVEINPESLAIITNPPFSLKKKFFIKCMEYGCPFALLIPADYSLWIIDAVRKYGCKKLVPTRRIDYITPSGKESHSQFHSMWLCKDFDLPEQETFVELTNNEKENI